MVEDMVKNYCVKVSLYGVTSAPNFMKLYQAVQKLLVGDIQTDTHADRRTGDLISLLSFLKSKLKMNTVI
jgi:hypothetical protein